MTEPTLSPEQAFLQQGAARAAALLRAVGNERRLLVLCLLIEHGELSVGELLQQIPLSQSALSQHLARMREEGLVAGHRVGTDSFVQRRKSDRRDVRERALQSVGPRVPA